MKTSWTQGLTKEKAEEIRREYASSGILRERLAALITSKMDVSRSNARAKNKYESPSWGYLQADAIGYERALSEIIDLIITKNVE